MKIEKILGSLGFALLVTACGSVQNTEDSLKTDTLKEKLERTSQSSQNCAVSWLSIATPSNESFYANPVPVRAVVDEEIPEATEILFFRECELEEANCPERGYIPLGTSLSGEEISVELPVNQRVKIWAEGSSPMRNGEISVCTSPIVVVNVLESKCLGDLNHDGERNLVDLGDFQIAYQSGDDRVADLNGDGVVNLLDLGIFSQFYGQSCVSF